MLARTFCFGSPYRAAALSALLWLAVSSFAFGQNASDSTQEARPSDVEGGKPEDDGGLQPGLIQAREELPEFKIINELITEGEELRFRKETKGHDCEKAFLEALKSANPSLSDAEKKALDAGAKYHIYRFTLKKYFEEEPPAKKGPPGTPPPKAAPPRERLHDLRRKLIADIKLYAKNPVVREYFLKQLTERSAELLDNNLIVRQNIILLIGHLPLDNGQPTKNPPVEPTPYVAAYPVLLKVIKDEKQHESLKIASLVGLLRICRLGLATADPANDKKRAEIAMALVPELAKSNTHYWYQFRLAECLGAAGVTFDPANKTNPIVLQTLAEVVADKNRRWLPRCEAAKAIGRLPLDNTLNMTPVLFEIVKLGYDMAQAHNANPKKEDWPYYFIYQLYFAFKPANANDRIAGGKRKAGLLEGIPGKEGKDAFEQILQMALQFTANQGQQFGAQQLNGFDVWLKNHEPANKRITANSPELGTKPPPVTKPMPMPVNGNKSAMPPTTPVAGPAPEQQ